MALHNRNLARALVLPAVVSAVALLAACDRESSGTSSIGQRVERAGKDTGAAAANATEAVADKAKDMGITAAVNAALVGDPALSALRINVDTVNGRVLLRGTAPDNAARDRASQLARSVKGVVDVNNELTLKPQG